MTVASIKKISGERVHVCLENGEEISSTLSVVTELRLYSGKELDGDGLERLRNDSALALAREKALEYLSRRPMSRMELNKKLREKGVEPETAAVCVDWLTERGLLDDESYAVLLCRHYSMKGYGPARIEGELRRRGIERELWEAALGGIGENSDKIDRFIASRLTDPQDREQRRKISAALYRRGYSWETIRAAFDRFEVAIEE